MKQISSKENSEIKHLIKLQKKQYRHQHEQYCAEGLRTVTTLLEKSAPVRLYITERAAQENPSLRQYPITIISESIANHASNRSTSSGIIGLFSFTKHELTDLVGHSIALYQLQDPGNMGTIIRTAIALGITQVYTINCVDIYNPKVVQSTAGLLNHVTIQEVTWEQITASNVITCGLVPQKGSNPESLNYDNCMLVLGNEANGLPESVINECDKLMTIDMPGNVESLNASVAGAISLYVMTQQKK